MSGAQDAAQDHGRDDEKRPVTALGTATNTVRGGLIGMAELVPGVSGGTIALIVGVYERLIASGNHLVSGLKQLVLGPDRAEGKRELGKIDFGLVVPIVIGMFLTVFTMASVMETFVTEHEELSRGLFLGMVAASVTVPLTLIDKRDLRIGGQKGRAAAIVAVVAVVFFFLTGLGGAGDQDNPALPLVFVAAAIAVCALVLPGVSGSFFLLTIGLYAPTVSAVSDRDLLYLAVFALGALTGLGLFVKLLHWLLNHHHTLVMLVMAGLMLGSLRALWPWQTDDRTMLSPGDDLLPVLGMVLLGAVLVLALIAVDRKLSAEELEQDEEHARA